MIQMNSNSSLILSANATLSGAGAVTLMENGDGS
jgi:hypothetical protein